MRAVFTWAWVFAALPATATGARAAATMTTDAGRPVHWERQEITIAIDAAFGSRHVAEAAVALAIDEAAAAWNGLPEMNKKLVRVPNAAAAAVKVRFCRTAWGRAAGLLGHSAFDAQVASGLVEKAVIEVNECDFKFVGPEDVSDGHLDLQAVLTHELGHVLGLAHSEDPAAVMFTSTGHVRQRRPNADDRSGLARIYGTAPSTPPLRHAPAEASAVEPAQVYAGGKDSPLPFVLPWPTDAGKSAARFVPTVLPVTTRGGAPRSATFAGTSPLEPAPSVGARPAKSNAVASVQKPTAAQRPTVRRKDKRRAHLPLPVELPWPEAPR